MSFSNPLLPCSELEHEERARELHLEKVKLQQDLEAIRKQLGAQEGKGGGGGGGEVPKSLALEEMDVVLENNLVNAGGDFLRLSTHSPIPFVNLQVLEAGAGGGEGAGGTAAAADGVPPITVSVMGGGSDSTWAQSRAGYVCVCAFSHVYVY